MQLLPAVTSLHTELPLLQQHRVGSVFSRERGTVRMQLTSLCQPNLEHQNSVLISLFIHLSITAAHIAPTNVMGCIQPQTVLDLTLGCKDRWESVPLALAVSLHISPTSSSWKGTEKTRIRKVWDLYHVCCETGRSCPHSGTPSANLHWTLQTLELSHPPPWLGTDKGQVGCLPGIPQGARGRCAPSLPRTQGAAPWMSPSWHRPDPGREVTPQLINTSEVNLLCPCYSYRELMFPLHYMDALRWRLGKQQNILDCHCILIADNLQIQARTWEKIKHL